MYEGKKVVVVCPVGREFHLKTLFNYLIKSKHIVDEVQLWKCTKKPFDQYIINNFTDKHAPWCKSIEKPDFDGWQKHISNLSAFYEDCIDENTIYIKMDDDICWIHPDCIESMCKTLLLLSNQTANPLVSANVINASHTHQYYASRNFIPPSFAGDFSYYEKGELAGFLHYITTSLIKAKHEDVFPIQRIFKHDKYVSINMIAWNGDTMKQLIPFGTHDEGYLNKEGKRKINAKWYVDGNAVCAHFAYRPSAKYLSQCTKFLDIYHQLSLQ